MKFDNKGLIPAIIQDHETRKVLMLGYMNLEAFEKTKESGLVTFYSRSKERIWTKGESSENYLHLIEWSLDCDEDTILIKARPDGPTCHTGKDTCWSEENSHNDLGFISKLEKIISDRHDAPTKDSYTSSLFKKGTNKIAQKVGEEAVELVIEAMSDNDELFLGEAADLLFHYLILLKNRKLELSDVINILKERHSQD